jgi:hypothetical protein
LLVLLSMLSAMAVGTITQRVSAEVSVDDVCAVQPADVWPRWNIKTALSGWGELVRAGRAVILTFPCA